MTSSEQAQRIGEATALISNGLKELSRADWTGAEVLRDAGAQAVLEEIEFSLMEHYGFDEGAQVYMAALENVAAQMNA